MCIHMNILLVGMLTTTLWRYINHRTLQQFKQSLLNALATNITGNAGIITLTCYLVYLVNKDNTALSSLYIIVSNLKQARQNTFHILAYITSLCKHSSVNNGERYIQHLGNGTGQQSLTRSCRTHHNDVRLFYFHTIVIRGLLQALVVVIHCYRKEALRLILSYHILVKMLLDFLGFRYTFQLKRRSFLLGIGTITISCCHLISLHGTIFADASIHTRYQEPYLLF